MHKLISTSLGIGYIKGGGTIASAFCCVCLYYAQACGINSTWISIFLALAIFAIGVYSAGRVEQHWGKDNYRVVIDEIAGMYITMMFIPVTITTLIAGFILFRLFDIVKPFYIRRLEKLPGGIGVMMDDVLAGIYANIVLQVAIFVSLL